MIDVLLNVYFFYIFITKYNKIKSKPRCVLVFTSMYMVFVLSLFVALLINGQSLYYGLTGLSSMYLGIGLFYYLYTKDIPESFIKQMFWVLAGG